MKTILVIDILYLTIGLFSLAGLFFYKFPPAGVPWFIYFPLIFSTVTYILLMITEIKKDFRLIKTMKELGL